MSDLVHDIRGRQRGLESDGGCLDNCSLFASEIIVFSRLT